MKAIYISILACLCLLFVWTLYNTYKVRKTQPRALNTPKTERGDTIIDTAGWISEHSQIPLKQ